MTRYLYRVEWRDIRTDRAVAREPMIAGGVRDAREARALASHAFGSRPFRRAKGIRGTPVIDRVRRIGPDTPAARDRLAVLR